MSNYALFDILHSVDFIFYHQFDEIFYSRIFKLQIIRKCWNFQQRSISKNRIIVELLGINNKPKRPLTPFLRYAMDQKPQITAEHPEKAFKDILKILGNQWSELPDSKKEKYYKDYQAERSIYFSKIKEFEDSLTNIEKKELIQLISDLKDLKTPKASAIVKNILQKNLNKPKPPYTTFFKYYNNFDHKGGVEMARKVSAQWKLLSEEEKKKYKDEYVKEYAQYLKDLEKWEKQMINEGHVDVVRLKTLKEMLQKTT